MKKLLLLFILWFLALPGPSVPAERGLTVKAVRFFSYAAFTRIVLETEGAVPYVLTRAANGREIVLSASDGTITLTAALPTIHDGVVSGLEARDEGDRKFILIRLDAAAGDVKDFVLHGPDRIVLDIAKGAGAAPAPAAAPPEKPVVIVLDPGHGGRDTGIVTPQGTEKSITLDLAQAIKKNLLKDRRLKVVLTRDRDVGSGLDERAAAANGAGGALFVSLHAAAGARERVYIQDLEEDVNTQPQRPAGRDFLGYEAGSEEQARLWDRQQAGHVRESRMLGTAILKRLGEPSEPLRAPIALLKPVDAAAVLIEIGTERDRARTAQAVAQGIIEYAGQIR